MIRMRGIVLTALSGISGVVMPSSFRKRLAWSSVSRRASVKRSALAGIILFGVGAVGYLVLGAIVFAFMPRRG